MPGRPQPPDHGVTSSPQPDSGSRPTGHRLPAHRTRPPDPVKVVVTTLRDGPRRSAGGPPQGPGKDRPLEKLELAVHLHTDALGHLTGTARTWRADQPRPGQLYWSSPLGYRYEVTPSGTRMLA